MSFSKPDVRTVKPISISWQELGLNKPGEIWLGSSKSRHKLLRYRAAMLQDGYNYEALVYDFYVKWKKEGGVQNL